MAKINPIASAVKAASVTSGTVARAAAPAAAPVSSATPAQNQAKAAMISQQVPNPSGGAGVLPDSVAAQYQSQGAAAPVVDTGPTAAERAAASAWLGNILAAYGMGDLAGSVDSLVQQWGVNTDVISMELKKTDSYKTRFAGLLALRAKGITDVPDEGSYIRLESNYRQKFRENGLSGFLGPEGSAAERAGIADLVGKYSLSVDEVGARIADAQRVAANTAPEVRDAFKTYFNVDPNMLVQYALDPQRTMDAINRQANMAVAGGVAQTQHLGIGQGVAGQIADLSGSNDINAGQINLSMTDARSLRDATKRLAQIENTDLTDDESVQASMSLNADAQKKVTGLQSRERARFSGSSSTVKGTLSRNRGV